MPVVNRRVLESLRSSPDTAGIVFDFDGTLSDIVLAPEDATVVDGAHDVLIRLAKKFKLVAVVSGRPVDFLEQHVPKSVTMVGLYGLEVRHRGKRTDVDGAGNWREVIEDVAARARARGPEGMRVESKGLSLTLHFRERPDLQAAVQAWAEEEAGRSGLRARPAKMSVELHPPIETDKGTVLEWLSRGLETLVYAGDDVGDLPGYDALDRLADRGLATIRIAVRGDEVPPELLERADLVVDGPDGLLDWAADLLS